MPSQGGYHHIALLLPASKTWRFGALLYNGVAYLDNYVEREDTSSQRVHGAYMHITPQFERLAAGQRMGNE